MQAVNLSGMQFGRWTVLHRANAIHDRRRSGYWSAKCACGKEKIIQGNHLTSGVSKSCGCATTERVQKPFGVAAKNALLKHYTTHAKERNLSWSITTDFFFSLTQMPCHYCGSKPSNKITTPGGFFIYNGVDRMDSSNGYAESNVVPCCELCNRSKSDRPYQSFIDWIMKAADHIRRERNRGEGLDNALDSCIEALQKI